MSLIKYSPTKRRSSKPVVTISFKSLQLNREAQKFFKGSGFAELWFDDDKKRVGIKPLERETESSVRVRKYPDRSIAIISAEEFVSRYGLDTLLSLGKLRPGLNTPKKSERVDAEWDDKEKMLFLNIRKA